MSESVPLRNFPSPGDPDWSDEPPSLEVVTDDARESSDGAVDEDPVVETTAPQRDARPLPEMGTSQVIQANSRHLPLADNSVDLVVTSPPYFALRSYQDGGAHYAGQIGDEPTPAEFVESLLEVTRECMRVLKPSGSLWVNLGDKYSRGSRPLAQPDQFRDGDDITYDDPKYVKNMAPENSGVAGKSLIGIHWRYALRCIDDLGLILRAEVIWSKPNGLPESVTDRVRRSHEQWFHFTLNSRYFSAVDEIREEHQDKSAHAASRRDRTDKRLDLVDAGRASTGNSLGKLPSSVWTIPTEPLRVPDHLGIDHFAAFPTEWPKRIIMGWSPSGVCSECGEGRRAVVEAVRTFDGEPVGQGDGSIYGVERTVARNKGVGNWRFGVDRRITGYACACPEPNAPTTPAVVLDPFGGTGTTAMVAKALGRHGITVDMSADYCRLAEWRTNDPEQLARVRNMYRYGVRKPTKRQVAEGKWVG